MKLDLTKNHIFCGDNLEWLNKVPDESVDLCYIDPPFFSNRNFEVIWGNGYERRAFEDRFSGRIANYIEWMRPRIELIHKKLKPNGTIFLHCDWHASHRLRCVLDDVFTESGFVNEITWKRVHTVKGNFGQGRKGLDPNTDSIFFYAKGPAYQFVQPFNTYSEDYLKKFYKHTEPDGRRYRLISMIGPGGAAKGNPFYEVMGIKKFWRYSKKKMKELIESGMVVQTKPGTVPQRKQYLDTGKGVAIQTLWDDILFSNGETLGYPTQKPEQLIKRIIEIASQPGDVVLDCFAGGGTTAKVASELGRKFIIGDVSPVAVRVCAERLRFDCPNIEFEVKNLPKTVAGFKKINGHQFAEIVCDLMGWEVNKKKSGDGGIDGWNGMDHPVQIKNHSQKTGRPDIQKFYGALATEKKKSGVFVAWDFSKDAIEYIADVKREHKIEIVPLKAEEILKGLLIDESKESELEKLYKKRKPATWDGKSDTSATVKEHLKVKEKEQQVRVKLKKGRKKDVPESR